MTSPIGLGAFILCCFGMRAALAFICWIARKDDIL